LYRESGKTLRDFCKDESLEAARVKRWLRRQKMGSTEPVRFLEVEAPSPSVAAWQRPGKYRLGFANGSWIEVEGAFEEGEVRALAAILREGRC